MSTGRLRLLVAGAVVLTGCTSGPADTAGSEADLPAPPGTVQSPAGVHGPTDQDEDLPELPAYPAWTAEARSSATQTAERAMRLFARPKANAQVWWSELSPMLSPAAATAYQGTDPSEVPAGGITGPAALVDERTPFLAGVDVPTDAGLYRVLLSRQGAGAPWLVERLTPPARAAS